jgi:hypothetical protein
VAIILPVLGGLFDAGRYDAAFALIAFAPILGVSLWWLLMRSGRDAPDLF